MTILDPDDLILGDRNIIKKPLTHKRGLYVLPNYTSLQTPFLRFLDDVATRLNRELPKDLDADGYVGASGIAEDFDFMRTPAGYGMSPVTYLPVNNERLRTSLGLPTSWVSDRHRKIFRKLFHLMFSHWVPKAYRTAKHSKSGIPWLEYDAEVKRKMVEKILCRPAYHEVHRLLAAGKLDRLFKDHDYTLAYVHGTRWQTDRPGKKRLVADLEYALSGGERGHLIESDKRVFWEGSQLENFAAQRIRLIQGLSLLPAAVEQIKFAGHLQWLFTRYPKTFHHRDAETSVADAEEGDDIIAWDVSQYDATVPWFIFEEMLDVMGEYYSPEHVLHTRMTLQAPYLTPPVEEGAEHVWVGNPTNPSDFTIQGGIRSGHPIVAISGKVIMTGNTLCILDARHGDAYEAMESYLDHQRPARYFNGGDDGRLNAPIQLCADYRRLATFKKGAVLQHSYFLLEDELGKGFLGALIQRTGGRRLPLRKITTMLTKQFIPERGVDSILRPYWPIGFYDSALLYSTHPAYRIVKAVVNDSWDRLSGARPIEDIVRDAFREMARPLSLAKTPQDYLLLLDPSKLHYAGIDEEDVSKEVLDLISLKIQPEDWIENFRPNYHGEIVQ